ncbi:MAG: mechanosensitive ion channel family protein [Rhodobacteraceae bacterium]|nr:mechanosensitive ion channel family protein [Paracoccaceae bacterium]
MIWPAGWTNWPADAAREAGDGRGGRGARQRRYGRPGRNRADRHRHRRPAGVCRPAPFIKVTDLGASSVDFTSRAWCRAGDYWDLKFDLTRRVKDGFDANGIAIPFPTSIEMTRAA